MTKMEAAAKLQIVAFGPDKMRMFVTETGDIAVDCNRNVDGSWTASAEGIADVTVPADGQPGPTYRQGAITAMCNQALAALPDDGYSILVPHGLAETP